jgi:hypothetical protein
MWVCGIQPETGYFTAPFDYCSAKCRTNAKSTVHENAYKSRYHHCFGSEASPAEVRIPFYFWETPSTFGPVAMVFVILYLLRYYLLYTTVAYVVVMAVFYSSVLQL